MIQTYISQENLIAASKLEDHCVSGLIDWCMTKAGMEKHAAPVKFIYVMNIAPGELIPIGSGDLYSAEEILYEVMYDNDPRAGLLIIQEPPMDS